MTTAKVLIILLMLTVVLTTSTVLVSALARPTDTAALIAGLMRPTTVISWVVLAIIWVGDRVVRAVHEARDEVAGLIARLADRLGDQVLAAELEHHLKRAEEGSNSSIKFLDDRRR